MVRSRTRPGRAHAEDRGRDHRSDGWPHIERATARRQSHQAGRGHHSRSGRRDDGHGPEEISDQQLRTVLGHEESLHYRRRHALLERRQESDAHHHGPRVARLRSHAEPHEEEGAVSMDRRTTIKWMFAAAAAVPSLRTLGAMPEPLAREVAANQAGYGTDPNLIKEWKPGGPWPLTLTANGRRTTQALCDLIIPADDHSPAASAVGVVEFIDEWISAPYPNQRGDRDIVLAGLNWIDAEANKRFSRGFADITDGQKSAIADDIC